ncbi:MAG: cell division protein FtsL [Clostridia bacterium]|nr:cell division protein FtsL [Clostridia bacterium]
MANGPIGYEYGTSPRKIQYQENEKTRRNNRQKNTKVMTKKRKHRLTSKEKFIFYLAVTFSIVLVVSYRNSLITEEFNLKEKNKKELSALEKENEQLRVSIESSLNLNNIGAAAKEQLGMQKLDNSQKVYISLPKKDYVEAATEEVIIEKETSWGQKIIDKIIKK